MSIAIASIGNKQRLIIFAKANIEVEKRQQLLSLPFAVNLILNRMLVSGIHYWKK